MSQLLTPKEDKRILNILASDGTFRLPVTEDTPGAVRRDYETSDKKKGTKYELVYQKVEGYITGFDIYEGDFGKNLLFTISKDDEQITVSLGAATPFGEDLMKKLPNIDFTKEVSLEPFSFENDSGKPVKGVSIKQDGEKVKSYYFDPDNKKNINGMPEPEGDTKKFDTDDWKGYFLKVRKFLLGETERIMNEKQLRKSKESTDTEQESDDAQKNEDDKAAEEAINNF